MADSTKPSQKWEVEARIPGGLPPFYVVTEESPCAYLPGRMERKLVNLCGPESLSRAALSAFNRAGFRRSLDLLYRPICKSCQLCQPVRIRLTDWSPSKSQRRLLKKNASLELELKPALGSEEGFRLFRSYIESRHGGGSMEEMDRLEFQDMMETGGRLSQVGEWRNARRKLKAFCLFDKLDDGYSLVYSCFTPNEQANSLGSLMIVDLALRARAEGLSYLYLGYWVPGSRKMDYKKKFRPLETFGPQGWGELKA